MKKLATILLIVALVACLADLGVCARRTSGPLERKVMIIGIDGLEWDIMGPMIEAGRLPHFGKLIREGTWGEIQSLEGMGSPVVWTSIATGKGPEKHGILGFTARPKLPADADGILVTSGWRKVKTIWQILGDEGRTVGIVNWLVTWPAEPVNGYLVADYFSHDYQWDEALRVEERMTFPRELAQELAPFRMKPGGVSDATASRFVTGPWSGDEYLTSKLRTLKGCVASDETARAVGLHLLESRPVDLLAVYLKGIDNVSHWFWADMYPGSGAPTDTTEVRAFGETIARYYEYTDELLRQFLDHADDGWTLIVTSDHGFSGPKPRGDSFAVGTAMHDPTGVVILAGKDIVRGRKLVNPSVLDITPTILALYGLPVASDMDGTVLSDAIDPAFLKAHPIQRVETYEKAEADSTRHEEPATSPVDEQVREQLRSLGYLK